MAKMNRRKNAPDFKKVKIKAGRRLPKHLNETKPEFKAKKIFVKPFSNSSSADLIRLLSSASINTALKLKYLGKLNKDLGESLAVSAQGGEQIQVVGKFLTDVDHRVREAAINCLKTCLTAISGASGDEGGEGQSSSGQKESLSPLLSILLTFVNCGITHINESIRDDSCKFFGYLLDRCDASLEEHLMQMFISKIDASFAKTLDAEYYRLLEKFVAKIDGNRRQRRRRRQQQLTDDNGADSASSTINALLHRSTDLARRFDAFQELNLTFQSRSQHVNTAEQFAATVGAMVVKDVKALFGKGLVRMLNPADGQKACSALKIALVSGDEEEEGEEGVSCHLKELLHFWRLPGHSLPTVKVVGNVNNSASQSKGVKAAKQVAHLQNELNGHLNRVRKVLAPPPPSSQPKGLNFNCT